MERKHIDYFDPLRLMAALGVIYMHTAAGPLRQGITADWHFMNVLTSLAFTAVPLFFMMSGALLMTSEKTADVSVLLKKRLPRLLVPLIGWTVVAALWYAFSTHELTAAGVFSRLAAALREPASLPFWYLYTLIPIYALSPFLYSAVSRLDEKGRRYLLALILLVSLPALIRPFLPSESGYLATIDLIERLRLFDGHLAVFLLGFLLATTEKRAPDRILIPLAAALLAIITVGTYLLTAKTGGFDQRFQNQSAGFEVALAACLFLAFKQGVFKAPAWLRRSSLVPLLLPVYLMHGIALDMLYKVGVVPATFIDTLLVALSVFLLCLLTVKTVATLRPLCYLATGLTYDEACKSCNWVYTAKQLRAASQSFASRHDAK